MGKIYALLQSDMKSVVFTPDGLERAQQLFETMFRE
jgi:hypothetical protein